MDSKFLTKIANLCHGMQILNQNINFMSFITFFNTIQQKES